MEIAEDAEEDSRAKRQSTVPEERPSTAKAPSITTTSVPLLASPPKLLTSDSYRSVISNLETSPPPPREPDPEPQPRSPTKTLDERRKSSQSTRPDLYTLASYGSNGKPKIKLGPRPSLDVGGRPHTSSAASQFRPVSTLPAGLKLFSRGSKKDKDRPKSHKLTEPPSMTISPPPIPDAMAGSLQVPATRPHTSGGRPTTSSGVSIKSAISPKTATFPKTPTITPEKARLMKALELRKKREMASPPTTEPTPPNTEEALKSPTPVHDRLSMGAPKEVNDTLSMLNDMAKGDDSGIAFDASSTMKTDESDATRSDSYPVSPVGPSEQAESTRASSISESTDETIQEAQVRRRISEEVPEESESTTKQFEEVVASLPTEKAVEEVPAVMVEDLPQLQPVTYTPISSPVEKEVKHMDHAAAAVPNDSALADLSAKVLGTPVVVQDSTEEMPSQISPVEADIQASTIEFPEEVTKFEHVQEHAAEPISLIRPEIKEWKVPRSKFSSQSLKAEAEVPAIPKEPMPLTSRESTANAVPKSPIGSTSSADTKREDDGQENGPLSSKRTKRRALIEPIRTDLDVADVSAANSEANFSSDDDLMDELQSAVFQEAKPISVSKSPISPVFPSPKKKVGNRFSRAFSSPMRKESSDPQKLTPDLGRSESSRSVSASAAYLNRINQQPAKPLAKKVNLGSGISSRIKALEKLSANAPGATMTPGTTAPTASPAFFSVRKGTVRGASKSPSIAERANSLTRNTTTPSPSVSRESSPETLKLRERSGSVQSRLNAFNASPVPAQPQHSRPESISVTARIVRDPNQPFPKAELGKDPFEYAPLDLKQSPLVIDHQKAVTTLPQPPKETIQERRLSTSSRTTSKSRRSSITVVKDLIKEGRASFSADRRRSMNLEPSAASPSILSPGRSSRPPSVHQSPAHQRPMSISSRRSTSSRDQAFSPPPTAGSGSSTNDEKEKKPNRASRMLRRMSSSLSSSRKNITHAMSPTVREESEPPVGPDSRSLTSSHPSNYSMTPITTSTNIGDVNVQFPDTLLWKRRSMLLDSQGTLILSPALSNGNAKEKAIGGATRRFHLSEFRTPAVPDVEMQELPNSVVLDFIEGGGLQIACEDRAGQVRVLNGKPTRTHHSLHQLTNHTSSPRRIPHLGSIRPINTTTVIFLTIYPRPTLDV